MRPSGTLTGSLSKPLAAVFSTRLNSKLCCLHKMPLQRFNSATSKMRAIRNAELKAGPYVAHVLECMFPKGSGIELYKLVQSWKGTPDTTYPILPNTGNIQDVRGKSQRRIFLYRIVF